MNELIEQTYELSLMQNLTPDIIARLAYNTQQLRKKYEADEKKYLEKLKHLAGDKTKEFGDFLLVRNTRKGSVEYDKIPELKEINLEVYRKGDVIVWQLIQK